MKKHHFDNMSNRSTGSTEGKSVLRHRAEQKVKSLSPENIDQLSIEETHQLIHELQVHQIELELQNEELRTTEIKLEDAKARYFDLYDLAPVGYLSLSNENLIVEGNLTAADMLGVSRDKLVNHRVSEFVTAEDQDFLYLNIKQLFATGTPQRFEVHMHCHDSLFWARINSSLVQRDEGSRGEAVYRITISDITDRKEAEISLVELSLKLEKSNQKLRTAQKNLVARNRIADVFLTTPDDEMYAQILEVVLEYLESPFGVFGYINKHGDLVVPSMTQDVWNICDVKDKNIIYPHNKWGDSSWARAISEQKTLCRNKPSSDLPEGHISISRQIALPLIHQGKAIGLLHVANKLTDYSTEDIDFLQVLGEAIAPVLAARIRRDSYKREKERLLSAIEQAGEMFVITDPEGRIEYVNPAFEQITGYSKSEAIGQMSSMMKSGKMSNEFYQEMWQTITTGSTFKCKMVNKKKDGTYFTEEAAISAVYNKEGEITNFVAVKHDITQQLQLEQQFQQAQKMESVGRLAGGVAHDYNNILTIIMGFAELAMDQLKPTEEVFEDLQEIHTAAIGGVDVTRQLLAFSRQETITPVLLDLNDTVAGMLKMLQRLIGEDIELSWLPDSNLSIVKVDPSQLDQILVNLCVNARDAITGVGKIWVTTIKKNFDRDFCYKNPWAVPGEFVMLSVSDDGSGMERELMSTIFEPFVTTKEVGKGTGLGLATVHGIVKQNNGFIEVSSELGKGSRFEIYLPHHHGPIEGKTIIDTDVIPNGMNEIILVVDDDPSIVRLAKRILQELKYTVITATTTTEALNIAQTYDQEITLLITDVIMPEMNGQELSQKIKEFRPSIKKIYMSGYPANVISDRGVLDEGIRFLHKPFTIKTMSAAVQKILDM